MIKMARLNDPNVPYDTSDTYREPLCTADDKGIRMYSPYCNRQMPAPQNIIQRKQQQSLFNNTGCIINPVQPLHPELNRFYDGATAHDWFKDPTYYERVALRKKGLNEMLLDTNPTLQEYHLIKKMELTASELMQTF
jgi:hypothetical protein